MVDNEQEAADFLERLDIDVNDFETKSKFESRLIDIFARGGRAVPTDNQIDTLFDVGETQFLDFPSNNIKRVEFIAHGRLRTRFVLPNRRGLFNFQSALDFLNKL
jgi:hypothetical protein